MSLNLRERNYHFVVHTIYLGSFISLGVGTREKIIISLMSLECHEQHEVNKTACFEVMADGVKSTSHQLIEWHCQMQKCSGQGFMQDKIIASHTCFGGHMDVNC